MPGPHMPPANSLHGGRRHSDYYNFSPMMQNHSQGTHLQYSGYPTQYYHGQPHPIIHPSQLSTFNPYANPHSQYAYPTRPPYSNQHAPVVVSSTPPHVSGPMGSMNRHHIHTPPMVHSPAPQPHRDQSPQIVSSTPSVMSQAAVAAPAQADTVLNATSPSSQTQLSQSQLPQPQQSGANSGMPSVQVQPLETRKMPFYPPLPWLSVPELPFPPRASRRRRRRRDANHPTESLELPSRVRLASEIVASSESESQAPTVHAPSDLETPMTSEAPSESGSTHPTTPSSALPPSSASTAETPTATIRTLTRAVVPAIPIKPVIPVIPASQRKSSSSTAPSVKATEQPLSSIDGTIIKQEESREGDSSEQTITVLSPTAKIPPKSWADLVRSKTSAAPVSSSSLTANGAAFTQTPGISKGSTLTDALKSFSVESENKIAFIEPRGLVNTGNMCYMNSILQILVFCVPFYDFLDQVGKRAVHSFKSETPLVEAMIMFMREFSVIDSAVSIQQLRLRLKDPELEQYGESFIPEYVYNVIRQLPRFSHMRRGHQQDAEEFLGFLLAGLHDECTQVTRQSTAPVDESDKLSSQGENPASNDDGWLEVGKKQKPSITRSSGIVEVETPITKIFGGKLRSELRVPGLKPSVTLEPYQPLQLDIGSSNINNITDALKGLTHSETLQGDFNSPRGPGTNATKQVFIESLPEVLILHLKRFQYNNTGGTQKIWRKIGYPLELEIPKEVFPPHKRGTLAVKGGLPRYQLIGVVYHHGKNASGGHYTVDVRRQEGREWIRLDDTVIKRIRSNDVAEAGVGEDPRVLAKILEQHRREQGTNGNYFEHAGLGNENQDNDDGSAVLNGDVSTPSATATSSSGWKEVNGMTHTNKKWSGVMNGSSTPGTPPLTSLRDGKVAYILFYQQIK